MHTALFSILILAPVIQSQRTNHGRFKLPEGTLFGNGWYSSNDVSDATKLLKNLSEITATEKRNSDQDLLLHEAYSLAKGRES